MQNSSPMKSQSLHMSNNIWFTVLISLDVKKLKQKMHIPGLSQLQQVTLALRVRSLSRLKRVARGASSPAVETLNF